MALEPIQTPHYRRRFGLVGRPRRTRSASAHHPPPLRRICRRIPQPIRQRLEPNHLRRLQEGVPRHSPHDSYARWHCRFATLLGVPMVNRRGSQLGWSSGANSYHDQQCAERPRIHVARCRRFCRRSRQSGGCRTLCSLARSGSLHSGAPHSQHCQSRALPLHDARLSRPL